MVVTIAAPIRLPAKTVAAVEAAVRDRLGRRPASADADLVVHDNRVGIRVVRGSGSRSKVLGLVYTPGPDLAALDALIRAKLGER